MSGIPKLTSKGELNSEQALFEKTTKRRVIEIDQCTFVERLITRPKKRTSELKVLVEDLLWELRERRLEE